MSLAGPALETVSIQTVNILNEISELEHDFKFFDALTKVAQASIFANLKYLFIQFEGMKEEVNYPALYKKLDSLLKKPLTIFI